ncbi:MAG TPA: PaaI family thioesterase [Allosphingosinicella sp.]|nr:PaaI family thioesterase [Allosphingosinicella sp.]
MPSSIFDSLPMPPVAKTLGWTLRAIDPDAGTIEIGFTAGEAFTNPTGAVQGGFVAAMLDDTMGPAVFAMGKGEIFAPTLDLHVSFIRPALPGAFVGKGRVVSLGKSIAFLEAELYDADGALVARSTATARVLPASSLLQGS